MTICVDGQVAWTGRNRGKRGFGVKFRLADRALAGRVAALVRTQEQLAGLVDCSATRLSRSGSVASPARSNRSAL